MYKLPEDINLELQKTFSRTLMINVILMLDFPLLGGIGFFLVNQSLVKPTPGFKGEMTLRISFLAFSFASLALAFYLKKIVFRPATHAKAKDLLEIIRKLSSYTIVTYALGEIPIIFGFVFYLLNGSLKDFILLIDIAILTFVLCWPRLKLWRELLLWILRNRPGILENPQTQN